MLEGWKEIANHLERISGRRRSRFTLMRLASGSGHGRLPVERDVNNRPIADADRLSEWWAAHRYAYSNAPTAAERVKPTSVVYFIRDEQFIKIGFSSNDAEERLEVLQCGNPRQLVLMAVMPGSPKTETELHDRFSSLHVRGEWFKAEAELLQFIAQLS